MADIVILAAGKGTRLLPETRTVPKPLVALPDGTSILDYQMDQIIKSRAFQKIVYVGGYKYDAIKSHLNSHYPTVEFLFIENLQYYNTNAIMSLYLASLQELSNDY